MPRYSRPVTSQAIVSVDENGFVVVANGPLPFKDVYEDMGDGVIRYSRIVKHPTIGEVVVAITDVPSS